MAEASLRSIQIGPESAFGTSVAATTILPVDPGSGYFADDRATEIPDEDVGRALRNAQSGRASHGVRLVTGSLSAPACFQNLGHWLEMIVGTDSVAGSASPYTHTHTNVHSSDTLTNYTIEFNDDVQDFDIASCTITRLTLGFSELSAPGNAMWTVSADIQGQSMVKATATSALTIPTLETMEGHLTTLALGDTATAYGSLTGLSAHLLRYELSLERPRSPRKYGGSTDTADGWGFGKALATVSMGLKFSTDSISGVYDHFNVSGGLATARRARIAIDGSGNNAATIDHQLNKIKVAPAESNGEIILDVTAEAEYNTTLASDLVIAITNDVAALP